MPVPLTELDGVPVTLSNIISGESTFVHRHQDGQMDAGTGPPGTSVTPQLSPGNCPLPSTCLHGPLGPSPRLAKPTTGASVRKQKRHLNEKVTLNINNLAEFLDGTACSTIHFEFASNDL